MDLSRLPRKFSKPITTVDSHTEGEATRLIVDGIGDIPGKTMMEKLSLFKSKYDHVRLLLTSEPRGREVLVAMLTENVSPGASFGLIYMDAKRYPYLCGHATIGAVTTLGATGYIEFHEGENKVYVDTPSGIMDARVTVKDGEIVSVAVLMVPSFVFAIDKRIHVEGFGDILVDLVCTGGFFAMVEGSRIGIDPVIENRDVLVDLGMKIIDAANDQLQVQHPLNRDVNTVDVTEFYTSEIVDGQARGRGVVIYGESHMDRSPCGTGTASKLALLHHRGELDMHRPYINFSPLGTSFRAFLVEKTRVGELDAVVTQIEGRAWITGIHKFLIEPTDPFQQGFIL
ncbi:MAG: proline racemase family protein [Desulfamplus sp.]|nr:proline racemase family protein [Desulfamplus sp.]